MSDKLIPTSADKQISKCIDERRCFSMIAGAGSGKTSSLVMALNYIRQKDENWLLRDGKKILCITYTKRAVEVISKRLRHDDLYVVSTLHSFLWGEIHWFTCDIREALQEFVLPRHIEKARKEDNGKQTHRAIKAKERLAQLEEAQKLLNEVESFRYDEHSLSDYFNGQLNHDDVISVAGYLLQQKPVLRHGIGQRYPFIFVDEAQDTFQEIIDGINLVCDGNGLPLVGYFGDPMQQIYDKRTGNFCGPPESNTITKIENYRCSHQVIDFLNAFRKDVQQIPADTNKERKGSVKMCLIKADQPRKTGRRKEYSVEQLDRIDHLFQRALSNWGWDDNRKVIHLFLVRQMIARRLGFLNIHRLFTGPYASQKAQSKYEEGTHFLLKPLVNNVFPLIKASRDHDHKSIIDILLRSSPAFDIGGKNKDQSFQQMMDLSRKLSNELLHLWTSVTVREIMKYCYKHDILNLSDRFLKHLQRDARSETYDESKHAQEKENWLCDQFFEMDTGELEGYCEFIEENTPFSTQHGVKGDEYRNVLVVFDDLEAKWNLYNFCKLLTPNASGAPTDGQFERGRKLAYVCFSRAKEHLRIILYTPNPEEAKHELIGQKLLSENQIEIIFNP
ncbi:MAG: UvrD-helicase domain-containing protein [Bacteroidetes bacterium]|nr:UvrD-helicase domain-containing protein [Bacteroidota bacterium]